MLMDHEDEALESRGEWGWKRAMALAIRVLRVLKKKTVALPSVARTGTVKVGIDIPVENESANGQEVTRRSHMSSCWGRLGDDARGGFDEGEAEGGGRCSSKAKEELASAIASG